MRRRDPVLDWFLEDAKAQGLSLAEYERRYGIVLPNGMFPNAAQQRINRHEVPAGLVNDEDYRFAAHKEKRRAHARRNIDLLIDREADPEDEEPS